MSSMRSWNSIVFLAKSACCRAMRPRQCPCRVQTPHSRLSEASAIGGRGLNRVRATSKESNFRPHVPRLTAEESSICTTRVPIQYSSSSRHPCARLSSFLEICALFQQRHFLLLFTSFLFRPLSTAAKRHRRYARKDMLSQHYRHTRHVRQTGSPSWQCMSRWLKSWQTITCL